MRDHCAMTNTTLARDGVGGRDLVLAHLAGEPMP
jgi:hypothetical protein